MKFRLVRFEDDVFAAFAGNVELQTPVDWEREYLTLSRDEVVGFVMGRAAA